MSNPFQDIYVSLLEVSSGEDYAPVIQLAEKYQTTHPEAVCAALWTIAERHKTVEARRYLSFFIVRRICGAVAEASRLWLLAEPGDDPMTLVNILSGLSVKVVEGDGIPDYQYALLAEFLNHSITHPSDAVRISSLDFLRDHIEFQGPVRRLGQFAAKQLAKLLNQHLANIVEEEEELELESVSKSLRSSDIPANAPINLSSISKLIDELESLPIDKSQVDFVRVLRLHEDAKRQARHLDKPVVTVRTLVGGVENFMEKVRRIVDLCRMESAAPPETWLEAPAASVTTHLKASAATVKKTFERFQHVIAIADLKRRVSSLHDLPSRQAGVLASLLIEGSRAKIKAEIIFTDPRPLTSQLVLTFQPNWEQTRKWKPELDSIRSREDDEPEIYSEEVPQANTVNQVFQVIDAIIRKGEAEVGDIENISTPRQIAYYKQGARILGFLDEHNRPTSLAQQFYKQENDKRMHAAANAFNNSMVGKAWRTWANQVHLAKVEASTALSFLEQRAVGISGSTIPRRASTLRKWQIELIPFYRI